jgi:uncharacterized cupredoxin-like copper-binding protein
MKRHLGGRVVVVVLSVIMATVVAADLAQAKGDLTEQKAAPVVLTLGSKNNQMVFKPNTLKFETGKLYKLLLVNASPVKHEFDAPALSEAVFSHKVEVIGAGGEKLAEVYGRIGEIEVGPGVTVEWYFVPVKTIKNGEFICDVEGHLAAGMKGTFTIE